MVSSKRKIEMSLAHIVIDHKKTVASSEVSLGVTDGCINDDKV